MQECFGKQIRRPDDRLAHRSPDRCGGRCGVYDTVSRFHNTDLEQYRQQNHRFTELMKKLKVNLQMREVQRI